MKIAEFPFQQAIKQAIMGASYMQTRLSPADPDSQIGLTYAEIEQRIRLRAYQLYEQRGRADGHALDDWLEAKAEVLGVARRKAA